MAMAKRINYGIDAPLAVRNLSVAGIVCVVMGLLLKFLFVTAHPTLSTVLLICAILVACFPLCLVGLMVWGSKVGKILFCGRLLDSLALRGNETMVDIGCGRGLLLNAAAKRLPSGKAIGIDSWQSKDQSDNRPEATLASACAEGVEKRVEIKTADMRKIPLPDETVDVVISNMAIHNIPDQQGRTDAIREIARILKTGGRVALADLRAVDEYAQTLKTLGWQDVSVSRLDFTTFPPLRIVRGKKPH
jgi:SAM-dependent methyltransferase